VGAEFSRHAASFPIARTRANGAGRQPCGPPVVGINPDPVRRPRGKIGHRGQRTFTSHAKAIDPHRSPQRPLHQTPQARQIADRVISGCYAFPMAAPDKCGLGLCSVSGSAAAAKRPVTDPAKDNRPAAGCASSNSSRVALSAMVDVSAFIVSGSSQPQHRHRSVAVYAVFYPVHLPLLPLQSTG